MSVVADLERIRALRRRWFDETPKFTSSLNDSFDQIGFTQNYVGQLVQDASTGKYSRKSKVIKDNTWGMIEIDWQSVRLLDCPIVQRLRSVKQLGFSYLTYPSAEHSRFIHSLGMFAVVWRFLEAAARQNSDEDEPELDGIKRYPLVEREKKDLLHAAILHDVGHLPFSHATETPFKTDRKYFFCGPLNVEDFMFSIDEILEKPLQFSEGLSLAIILSPRFADFYSRFVRPGEEDPDMPLRLAALVAGMRPAPNLRGIAQVISSSSVDADKIDYINRDALACGIPVGLDVARLFLRSNFFTVRGDKLKALGVQKIENLDAEEVVFVVNSSGVDTIDELAHSKTALYQRVYLHQTTRNAERLLSVSLESLPLPTNDAPQPLRNAFYLLTLGDAALLRQLSEHTIEKVGAVGKRIRTRQLPRRACVFGRSLVLPLMPIPEILPGISPSDLFKQTLGMVVGNLRSEILKGEKIRQLEMDVLNDAEKLAALLRAHDSMLAPTQAKPTIVTVLPMRELPGQTKEAIVLENNELTYSSNRSISDEQNEAADLYKALGYVLTDRDWREIVCLSARKVIALHNREPVRAISLPKRVGDDTQSITLKCTGRLALDQKAITRRASLQTERAEQLTSMAAKLGYFDDVPWIYPEREADFNLLAERLRKFDGQGGWTVSAASCAAFVSQFPPRLRGEISAKLLNDLVVIDREMIKAQLVPLLLALKSGYDSVVVTGFSPDSGNIVRMLLEHEAKQTLENNSVTVAKDLRSALDGLKTDSRLVLVDDVISSGSQAQCQFRSWFGVPRTDWPAAHQTELGVTASTLENRYKEMLKGASVTLAICTGSSGAISELTDVVKNLGVAKFDVSIGNDLQHSPLTMTSELTHFLSELGANLIAYNRYGKERLADLEAAKQEDCLLNSLGYGNAKALLATSFNVPTCTLTCLWCPGMASGSPWMPLLIRRGYLDKLIVA